MVPPAQRDWADMSLASNPRLGPQKPTAFLRVFDIVVGLFSLTVLPES